MEGICTAGDLDKQPVFPYSIDGHNFILGDEAMLKSGKEYHSKDVHYADLSRKCGV
jgi:hypothetical protein